MIGTKHEIYGSRGKILEKILGIYIYIPGRYGK